LSSFHTQAVNRKRRRIGDLAAHVLKRSGKLIPDRQDLVSGCGFGAAIRPPLLARPEGDKKMTSKNQQAEATRARIDDFGPKPTVRRQVITLAAAGTAMVAISGILNYFGLI
jgi:hypothetical protein